MLLLGTRRNLQSLRSQFRARPNISRRRDMLYGTQRGGQMRHFRKDLKTATRLGAVRY